MNAELHREAVRVREDVAYLACKLQEEDPLGLAVGKAEEAWDLLYDVTELLFYAR